RRLRMGLDVLFPECSRIPWNALRAAKPVATRSFDPVDQMKVEQAPAGALRRTPSRPRLVRLLALLFPSADTSEGWCPGCNR
ncbi:MAG: hypothetical protein AAFY34_16485, partial [Pseudomonadota bacterium]